MPAWFRQHGYTTVAVGKVSHHPGGMGGKQWDDPSDLEMPAAWDRQPLPVGAWKSPSGIMHGLAHGEIRGQSGDMDVFQSVDGPDDIYPDGLIVREGLKQLEELASSKDKPFFLAIGVIKPHLPFGAPKAYFDLYDGAKLPPVPHPEKPGFKTTWHKSGEFMKYRRWGRDPCTDPEFADDVRRHYAACVSYTDKHVGDILNRLKETGAEENTVVLIWGDHGWHLGEHGVWGKHTLFEEALRAPLIIRYPGMKERGKTCHAVVDTVNIFPTLCEITGVPGPDFADGKSLLPMLEDTSHAGHPAVAYWGGKQSLRNDRYRLVVHEDGYVELYDHAGDAGETENIAGEHPDVVRELSAMLSERLKSAELDG